MARFQVNYEIGGRSNPANPDSSWSSSTNQRYSVIVEAQGSGSARDMVTAMNGGTQNCLVTSVIQQY
jgi:hypothetical protein